MITAKIASWLSQLASPANAGWIGRKAVTLALFVLVSAGAAYAAFHYVPFGSAAAQWVADFELASLQPPEPQHPDVVIVTVNEETLQQFPYRSPIDRRMLAEALKILEERGVKGILIDILFDQPTEPDKDALLKQTIAGLKVPLAISYGLTDGGLNEDQMAFENDFVPAHIRGFANLVTSMADGTARQIYPGRRLADGRFQRGVVGVLLEKLGGAPPDGQIDLAYRGQPDADTPPFKMFPIHTLRFLPKAWLAGKIVLIGTDLSLVDRHRTPFAVVREGEGGIIPGIMIHAHAMAQLLENRAAPQVSSRLEIGLCLLLATLGTLIGQATLSLRLRFLVGLPLMAGWLAGGMAVYHGGGLLLPALSPLAAFVIAGWMADLYASKEERDQKRFIQAAFAKFVPPSVLDEILKEPAALVVRAERREISVIFTDVANFTTLSESLDADQLSSLMNRYRSVVSKVVFDFRGTLNMFIGDGLFVMFNAPQRQPDHATRALACAQALDRAAQGFNQEIIAAGGAFGITRIGLHTATASVGNFGSVERFEYTALGDSVNTASRVEGLNKYFGTRLAVTRANADANSGTAFRPLGSIVLKGKTEPIEILEPLSDERAASPEIAAYLAAYAALTAGDPAALEMFRVLHEANPADGVVGFHYARLQAGDTGLVVRMHDK